ncbi:MAG: hypothetical protein ABH828_02780 [archaeon]
MNKKGQLQQVFIYLMTMIIVGLIVLIGYKAIGGLINKGCDVEISTFQKTLESYITKYSSFGSVHKETLNVPCSYKQICFVDTDIIGTNPFFYPDNTIIESSVKSNIEENIFLVSDKVTEPFGFMNEIVVEEGVICLNNTNGKFYIRFEGLGRRTAISSGVN